MVLFLVACDSKTTPNNKENNSENEIVVANNEEFPDIVVSENNLLSLIGSNVEAGERVFNVKAFEQDIDIQGVKQTIYTYSLPNKVDATLFVRNVEGEPIIYEVSIQSSNEEKVIQGSNVSLIGNILIDDITYEIANAYKDKFFPGTECKCNDTTISSNGVEKGMVRISSQDGDASIVYNGSTKDGKIERIQITSTKIVDVERDHSKTVQFSDTSDRSSYPDLFSTITSKRDDIEYFFGTPDSDSTYNDGEGQLIYRTELSLLTFEFHNERVFKIYYSTSNRHDTLKITDKIVYGNTANEIGDKVPEGLSYGSNGDSDGNYFRIMSNNNYNIKFTWKNAHYDHTDETEGPTSIEIEGY